MNQATIRDRVYVYFTNDFGKYVSIPECMAMCVCGFVYVRVLI